MKPLLPLLLAAGLLTACTDDPATTPSASSSTTSDRAPARPSAEPSGAAPSAAPAASSAAPSDEAPPAAPASGPAFPANTEVDTEAPTGDPLGVVAVRASRQEGYDRVVFELRGRDGDVGAPGWRVEYVEEARQDGSGDEVQVAGDSILSVFVEGVALPFETGREEASQDLFPKDTDRVREVDLSGTFEGRFTAFVGLDQRVPFRAFRLADPARVVVDVRHS